MESDLFYDPSFQRRDYQIPFRANHWCLYDDEVVKDFFNWFDVVKACVEGLIKPTTLFYQKVHEEIDKRCMSRFTSVLPDDSLAMSGVDLQMLETSARNQTLEMTRLTSLADEISPIELLF